ncbi:hypothetical protein EAE96_005515 [Botrytis aclada]|nr:hypothetical protein EAE96_005515 [Botrytis aclada]
MAIQNTDQSNVVSSQPPAPSTSATMSDTTPTTSAATTGPSAAPSTNATMSNSTPTTTAVTIITPAAPSTNTMMSNITPMTSAITTTLPDGLRIRNSPLELSLAIYLHLLCMTIAGGLPPILLAFHGQPEYTILQGMYQRANFVLSDATLPKFATFKRSTNLLSKIPYLQIRSENLRLSKINTDTLRLLTNHYCKLHNYFQTINFTAIQPTRTPHTPQYVLADANDNVRAILVHICHIMNASVQAPEFRLKFLGYDVLNPIDQSRMDDFVGSVSNGLASPGKIWVRGQELNREDGLPHDGLVWVWKRV